MPSTSVFWIHASNSTRFEQGYRDIAEYAGLPGREDPRVNILQLVYRWLSDWANGQWLMVLDNVDDDDVFFAVDKNVGGSMWQRKCVDQQQPLEAFLPQSSHGSIIITSRNSTAARNLVGSYGTIIKVGPMTETEAMGLLETKVPFGESSREDAKGLTQALECIPLAITHAAAYVVHRELTVADYLQRFHEKEANKARILNNNDAKDLRRDYSIRDPVVTTWQITFNQIRKTTPAATDLLALISMFDSQGIPECLLQNGADRLRFEDAIMPLMSFSLVRKQANKGFFEMHRLVQLSTREWLKSNNELLSWIHEALTAMVKVFPSGQYETWSLCQALLPHAKEVLAHESTSEEDILNRAAICKKVGWYLLERGEYAAGEVALRGALEARQKVLGQEDQDTLTSVSNLALILRKQGKYNEAESLDRQALKGREKVLGLEHPDTLLSVNSLAWVLQGLGKYDEAEPLNRRALKGREKVLGPEHPYTLCSVNSLAWVLQSQRKYYEAESMNRRALEEREKVLGPEHPDTFVSVNSLAWVLQSQGNYDAAEPLHRRALKGRENVLGLEHPDTLMSVSNLAWVLLRQEKFDEAEPLNRRALDGREKVLGLEHPLTLTSVSNLASILQGQGKYDEAESMNRRALEGREKMLGPEHPDTLVSVSKLISVLESQRKFDEVESLNRRALG